MTTGRVAGGAFIALMLTGCAGGQLGGASPEAKNPEGMAGRWILAAPSAPTCGMNFVGAPGARTGNVSPEGGCPGNFYLSRRWILETETLIINDDENNALARLKSSGGRFEGQSTAGLSVSLARPPAPPAN
jgi:hypothetical protein